MFALKVCYAGKKTELGEKGGTKENCPRCQAKNSWYDEKGCICSVQKQELKGY
jgi:hypothetical protein